MSDMGIFRTTISIENPLNRGVLHEMADVMIDTGSEYTWIPRPDLEALAITPERTARFCTADGRVLEGAIAFANVHAGGTSAPDIVVFADAGDMTLLGARALEGLNLRVDVVLKALVPAGRCQRRSRHDEQWIAAQDRSLPRRAGPSPCPGRQRDGYVVHRPRRRCVVLSEPSLESGSRLTKVSPPAESTSQR